MSKIGENPVRMANYCLEKWIEDENKTCEDGSEYVWQYDQRMKVIEPMISDTARFCVELTQRMKVPSSLDEGDVALECIRGTYDCERAKCWISSRLYQHATLQANAIYILFSTSFFSQGFQLWRSLFETHIVCEFLSKYVSNAALIQDYVAHTLLRSWIRAKKDTNAWCENVGKQLKYDPEQIKSPRILYDSKGWELREDYGWIRAVLPNGRTFKDVLDNVGSDMHVFYRIATMEVHPTLGQRFAVVRQTLPLPAVPMSLSGVCDTKELQLNFVTAKVLHLVTCRTDTFVSLDADMTKRFEKLKSKGESALEEWRRAAQSTVQGSRRSVLRRERYSCHAESRCKLQMGVLTRSASTWSGSRLNRYVSSPDQSARREATKLKNHSKWQKKFRNCSPARFDHGSRAAGSA